MFLIKPMDIMPSNDIDLRPKCSTSTAAKDIVLLRSAQLRNWADRSSMQDMSYTACLPRHGNKVTKVISAAVRGVPHEWWIAVRGDYTSRFRLLSADFLEAASCHATIATSVCSLRN